MPLERGLGPEMGAVVADVHRDHGVDVRLGVGVVLIEGGDRVERIRLTDGAVLDIDLVVIGHRGRPEHGLARGLGAHDRQRRGVRRHLHRGARAWWPPATWRAGRTTRFDEVMRVEHWDNAIAMGTHAAPIAARRRRRPSPSTPIPWFWSDQYDRKIQLAGRAAPDDRVEVVSGSVEERRFVAFYGRDGPGGGRAGHEPAGQGHAVAVADRGADVVGRRQIDGGSRMSSSCASGAGTIGTGAWRGRTPLRSMT